jgi:hypothetical protein
MASEGMKNTKIATALNGEGIDSPLEHRRNNGRSVLALRPKAGRSFWDSHAIYRILSDERYAGTLVCFKSERISVSATGNGRREKKLPKESWLRIPNALPAIVSPAQFEKVQASRQKSTRRSHVGNENAVPRSPFVGKVVCGHCNRRMKLVRTGRPFFRCDSPKSNTGLGCYDEKVRVTELEKILLAAVKLEAEKALALNEWRGKSKKSTPSEQSANMAERKRLDTNIALLERRGVALYEEFAEGKICKDSYVLEKSKNSANLEALQADVAKLNLVDAENANSSRTIITDESVLHRILNATEIMAETMSLVDHMIVFDDERVDVRFIFGDRTTPNQNGEEN